MGIERFPSAKKDLRRAILHKDRGFAVRLTPNGSTRHVKVANLDQDCLAASIPNSSQGFILVEREHLEQRIQISENESSITISEDAAIRAVEMIDAEISGNKRLIVKWRNKLSKGFAAFGHSLRRISRNPPKSRRMKKLEEEVKRLQNQVNRDSGTIVEMQIAGLIPMNGRPPVPLRNLHQMNYGCDWLSIAWKNDKLHLFFIESNLSRTDSVPSLTSNESRMRSAIKRGDVIIRYVHHWVDKDGEMHWDQ
ncbi:hypothetical protein N9O16_00390 [Candidatus Poseidoniaceae archaeon]|nr:hypothetical protein [Candidatus Poseidoniaceae archaeon]